MYIKHFLCFIFFINLRKQAIVSLFLADYLTMGEDTVG